MRLSGKDKGATLLEVMLVLAVAAMVLVMSIRYYRNATNSQNANLIIQQINTMIATAEALAQSAGGSFASLSAASITAVTGVTTTPYNTVYTVSSATPTGYIIGTGVLPLQVCTLVASEIGNTNLKITASCSGNAVSVTYNSAM